MPATRVTRAQYEARLNAITDKYDRLAGDKPPSLALASRESQELETYKASVQIVETARRSSAPKKSPAGKRARKAARRAAEEAAIAAAVRESVATTLAARAATRPVAEQLAGLSNDDLAAVTVAVRESADSPSPFWRPAPSPTRPVAESADTAPPAPPRPLHEMTDGELAEYSAPLLTSYGAAAGYQSPSWAAS